MSGSISIKNLNDVLGIPKLQYNGIRVKIDELEGREIIIKDFSELPDTQYGSNHNYLRIEADVMEDGLRKAITFNSSAKDIIQKLKKAKSQNALPVKATLRKVLKKDGIGYYWILE